MVIADTDTARQHHAEEPSMRRPDPLFTVDDVALRLSCSRGSVYALINSGKLASLKIGGLRRITGAAIDSLLEEAQA